LGEVDDAYTFMKAKAIMVVPLFSGSGMRVKIVEAMYKGKAVITTTIGAEGLDVKHGENIIIADRAEDFVDGIIKLLNNKNYYLQIVKNAQNFVKQNFNNKIVVRKLIKFYKEHI